MIVCLLRVNKDALDTYFEDTALLEDRLYGDEEEFDDGSELIDIDKSWDGILYLLSPDDRYTGPLSKVLFSGQYIDEEQDLGYGPAHFHSPEEVKAMHEKLSAITVEELENRFDADKMNEEGVYPSWSSKEEDLEYLIDNFKEIQRLYAAAAANGQAIITYMG